MSGAIVLGTIASGIAWMRLSAITVESNPTEYWRRSGAKAYNAMASVSTQETEAIRSSLAIAPVDDPEGRLDAEVDSCLDDLRNTVSNFLAARYTAESSDEYIARMKSWGYRFKSKEVFEQEYGSLSRQAARAGVDSDDPREIFEAMWEYPPSKRAVPRAIAIGSGAMAIEIATSNANRGFTGRLSGTMGEDLWHGGSSSTCRFWFSPPTSRETMADNNGEILAAQVGVIGVVKNAGRRPIILSLYYDREASRWWIDTVSVTNYIGTDEIWTCCEY